MRRSVRSLALVAAVALPAALVACGSDDDEDAPTTSSGPLAVVASTDVWASVVEAVGGDRVEVSALISDPSADPHSYESTPTDVAKVRAADLVVFNGGGYDEFVEDMVDGSDQSVIEAFEGEGHRHDEEDPASEEPAATEEDHADGEPTAADGHEHSEDNEHIWYELPAVAEVAERIAHELGDLRPDEADLFTANAERFHGQIDALAGKLDTLKQAHTGKRVAVTEPVAFYLIEDAGLDDVTPPEFVEAIEEDSDPPAAAVAETRAMVGQRQVAALIFNPQTATPVTDAVRADAQGAGVPVVELTETLPPDTGYLDWMGAQIDALATALG